LKVWMVGGKTPRHHNRSLQSKAIVDKALLVRPTTRAGESCGRGRGRERGR